MLIDAGEISDGETLGADVCIVGAGAAGIALALELIGAPGRVVVLEAGGEGDDPGARGIYRIAPGRAPSLEHDREQRARLGGNTSFWSGNCRPLDAHDFRRRDWVAHSGWPIERDELWPFYEAAHRICGLGDFACYDLEACRPLLAHAPIAADPAVLATRVVHACPVLGFAELHGPRLAAADNVSVCLRARATRLAADASGSAVRAVEAGGPAGRRFSVAARVVVLAAGGVENPRLLLCSVDGAGRALGNGHDLVGRFFMEHWWVDISLDPRDLTHDVLFHEGRQDVRGTTVWGQLALSEPFMETHRVPGLSLWFQAAEPVPLAERAGASLALMARGWTRRDDLAVELRLAAADPRTAARAALRQLRRPPRQAGLEDGHALRVQLEQTPDADNRVCLGMERDELGQPRAILQLRLAAHERRQHAAALRHAADALGLPGRRLSRQLDVLLAAGRGNFFWHHMGTTRMHADPTRGVVDADCRVHGMSNLFVAGSSLFPTGGTAAPTLTIVALAVRLARHLRRHHL